MFSAAMGTSYRSPRLCHPVFHEYCAEETALLLVRHGPAMQAHPCGSSGGVGCCTRSIAAAGCRSEQSCTSLEGHRASCTRLQCIAGRSCVLPWAPAHRAAQGRKQPPALLHSEGWVLQPHPSHSRSLCKHSSAPIWVKE